MKIENGTFFDCAIISMSKLINFWKEHFKLVPTTKQNLKGLDLKVLVNKNRYNIMLVIHLTLNMQKGYKISLKND